jgi:hypothetical protein
LPQTQLAKSEETAMFATLCGTRRSRRCQPALGFQGQDLPQQDPRFDFYRISEDLDFGISMPADTRRTARGKRIKQFPPQPSSAGG